MSTVKCMVIVICGLVVLWAGSATAGISNPSFEEEHDGLMPNGVDTSGNPDWGMPDDWPWRAVGNCNAHGVRGPQAWPTDGEWCLYMFAMTGHAHHQGDYLEFYQAVDLTDVCVITFDALLSTHAHTVSYFAVGAQKLWVSDVSGNHYGVSMDVSGFTGTHEIVLGVEVTEDYFGTGVADGQTAFDNLRDSGGPSAADPQTWGGIKRLFK